MNLKWLFAVGAACLAVGALADAKGVQLLKTHAEKLNALKSLSAELQVTAGEDSYRVSLQLMKPNKIRMQTGGIERISDGSKAWNYYPDKKKYTEQKSSDAAGSMQVDELMAWAPFFNAKAFDRVKDATASGTERIRGVECSVVIFSTSAGKTVKLYVDPATGIGRHAEVTVAKLKPLVVVSRAFTPDSSTVNDKTFAFKVPDGVTMTTEEELRGGGWKHNLNDALTTAKTARKPILIDFSATWCGPCQMMKKNVFPSPEFQAVAKNFVLVDIDVDANPSLAQKYGANAIPLFVFLDPDGNEVYRIVGYRPAAEFVAEMKKALEMMPR